MRILSPPPTRPRAVCAAAAAIVCAVAVAACGSSSSSKHGVSARVAAGIQFADCMRSHGVPNFPDPGSGGGIQIGSGSGINPSSPAFQQAQSTCQRLLPGGGPPKGPPSEQQKEQMFNLSRCMRAHGLNDFPDPTLGSPPQNPAGYSVVFGRPGLVLAVPNSINVNSPAFKRAASACHFPGG
jgi:hypothetical protein